MISVTKQSTEKLRDARSSAGWQPRFLEILPTIKRQLAAAFGRLPPELREEAVQEGIVNCLRAFVRLHQQDRLAAAFPSSLARYAILQGCAGRTVCSRLSSREPLSCYAQRRNRIIVERLDRYCAATAEWLEAIVEDQRASVPDRAALRIDVPAWLAGLSRRSRLIAADLGIGFATHEIASKYRLSAARISQIRRELYCSWLKFQGVTAQAAPDTA